MGALLFTAFRESVNGGYAEQYGTAHDGCFTHVKKKFG